MSVQLPIHSALGDCVPESWFSDPLFEFDVLNADRIKNPASFQPVMKTSTSAQYQAGPLLLRQEVTPVPDYGAARLDLSLTNTDAEPVTLCSLKPFRLAIQRQPREQILLRYYSGGRNRLGYLSEHWKEHTVATCAGRDDAWEIGNDSDGRSSNAYFPFVFLLSRAESGHEGGLVIGMEWSGAWSHSMFGNWGNPILTMTIPARGIRLAPHQKLDLPAIHLVGWTGGWSNGSNRLRRYVRDRLMPRVNGQVPLPLVSYQQWYGLGTAGASQDLLLPQLARAVELGIEIFEVDAGWQHYCGPDGNAFGVGTGNWFPDKAKYPNGLDFFSKQVRDRGLRFGLWLDIEKAFPRTAALREHSELFMSHPRDVFSHINLAKPEAQKFVIRTVSELIERYNVTYFRWDYNTSPLPFFEHQDERIEWKTGWQTPHEDGRTYFDAYVEAGPSGQLQFDYYRGLYRVLDTLLAKYPGLIIEGCASGGRRIDLAMMRRSHAFWISDHSENRHCCRFTQLAANRLGPGVLANRCIPFGKRVGDRVEGQNERYEPADILSRMCGSLQFAGDIAAMPPEAVAMTRRYVDLFKDFRHLLNEDFYPLLPQPARLDEPEIAQFGKPDQTEAVLFAFPPFTPRAGITAATMMALCAEATYVVRDLIADRTVRRSTGRQLMDLGLPLNFSKGQIYCYHVGQVK